MIRGFEGLGVVIKCFAWSVLGGSFIIEWLIGRGKNEGNIGGGGMSKISYYERIAEEQKTSREKTKKWRN